MIVVATFLGGISFAALVLILENSANFRGYSNLLTAELSVGSAAFLLTTLALLVPASGLNYPGSFARIGVIMFGFGLTGLFASLPTIILPYNQLAFVEVV